MSATTMRHKMCRFRFRFRDLLTVDGDGATRKRNGRSEGVWRSCTGREWYEQGREGLGLYFVSSCKMAEQAITFDG